MEESSPPIDPAPALGSDFSSSAICNLFPYLLVTESSEIDYPAADPALLVQLADAAESSLLIIHLGTSGIGRLLAQSATDAFSDEAIADSVEALGWLVAELNALAEVARKMARAGRGADVRLRATGHHRIDTQRQTIELDPSRINGRPRAAVFICG